MENSDFDKEAKRLLVGCAKNPWFLKKGDAFEIGDLQQHCFVPAYAMSNSKYSFMFNVEPLPFVFGEEVVEWENMATQEEKDQYEALLRVTDKQANAIVTQLSTDELHVWAHNRTFCMEFRVIAGKISRIKKKRTI